MKCQYTDCPEIAEYHIHEGARVCYTHVTAVLKHNPDVHTKCRCCGLLEVEAPKRERLKKRINEVQSRKNFSGEQSPYWNFNGGQQKSDREGNIEENIFANPDMLTESDSVFHRPLSERGQVQLEVVQRVVRQLSAQQQRVLYLCGQLGMSQSEAAKELAIGEPAVCKLLQRAQRAIREEYEKEIKKYYE